HVVGPGEHGGGGVPGGAAGGVLAIVDGDRVAGGQVRACGRGGDDELARRRRAVDREVRVPRATGGHRYRPGIRAAHRAVGRHAQRYHVVCRGEPGVRHVPGCADGLDRESVVYGRVGGGQVRACGGGGADELGRRQRAVDGEVRG